MIHLTDKTTVFEDQEIELRKKLIQRAIDILVDTENFESFAKDFDKLLLKYENSANTPVCPECENPYPHTIKSGGHYCEECGTTWIDKPITGEFIPDIINNKL